MTVYFSHSAERDVKRLSKHVQKELRTKHIPALVKNYHLGKKLHGPLRGYSSFEFHVNGVSYRMAYEHIQRDVVILMIDLRDNFYKKLSRRIR